MIIDFNDETGRITQSNQDLILDVLHFASDYLKLAKNTECSVTIVTNERIHEINREYRGVDRPTDVISFALDDQIDGVIDPVKPNDQMATVLNHHYGDIVISIDQATIQSKEYGHSLQRELGFLACHSLLHLLGYDHQTKEDEKEMFGLQKEILNAYGLTKEV